MMPLTTKLKAMTSEELRRYIAQLVNLSPACPFESCAGESVCVNGLNKMRGIGLDTAQMLYDRAKEVA